MGDQALVIFTNGVIVSPAVYLHWDGQSVPEALKQAEAIMAGKSCGYSPPRADDPSYSCARFAGVCTQAICGNMSVGLRMLSDDVADAIIDLIQRPDTNEGWTNAVRNVGKMADDLCLHAGLVVVDVRRIDWVWLAFGGYLEDDNEGEFEREPDDCEVPRFLRYALFRP